MKNKKTATDKKTKKKVFSRKRLFSLLFLATLIGGGAWLFTSPYGSIMLEKGKKVVAMIQDKSNLKLDQVNVEGRIRTKIEDINAAVQVEQGMPIFDVDLNAQKEKIKQLPWVEDVLIERRLPNQLLIRLKEKTPIAIWQNHKKYWPIDAEGKTIADDKTVISNVLLVVGEDAPQHAPQLIKELNKYPVIAKRVLSATRVGKRRWDLYLNDVENGLVVRLPETDIASALKRLQEFHETGQILERDLNVIDLKLPDRLIVRSEAGVSAPKKTTESKKK